MHFCDCEEVYKLERFHQCNPTSITCDEHCFFVCYGKHILEYDKSFCFRNDIRFSRSFFDFCYDAHRQCFYTLATQCPRTIFVLDINFHEIRHFDIDLSNQFPLLDLACCGDDLFVAYEHGVIQVDLCRHTQRLFYESCEELCNLLILDASLLVVQEDQHAYHFTLLDMQGHCKETFQHEFCGCLLDIVVCDCNLVFLYQDHCDEFFFIKVPLSCLKHSIPCEDHQPCESCEPCGPVDFNCLIKRTAEIEKAIACILNAEGMKIQHAIKTDGSIDDLLAINQSVTCTIIQITHLEHLLYTKLQGCCFDECCCEDACCLMDDCLKL